MKRVGIILSILILIGICYTYGQDNTHVDELRGGFIITAIVVNGDTVLMKNLPQVIIKDRRTFKNRRQAIRYNRLIRNVKKVYPYSQLAADLLKKYNEQLAALKTPGEKKQLMKKAEVELWDIYGDEIKDLTMTQGLILIKLIDRETGRTSYELVHDLRGGFTAFLFQSIARLFRLNLKLNYNEDGEDQKIEDIVLLIQRGEI
ncbi:MAG: DUF4294 domain-containing protein [Bacteroidota bacterium]